MANAQFEELTLEKLEMFLLRFSGEKRTGQLRVQGEGARGGRIDLHQGQIAGVESPFVSESLGEIARKLGFLSKTDMQKAVDVLSRSENAGKQLQGILLDEKLLTREGLEVCMRYQAESAIHSMIGFHGRISFMPGNVSRAEVELDPREVLARMKERDHVDEMGSAFLELVDSGPALGPEASQEGEYEAQAEMRRIAQAAIREVAIAAEAMQAEMDAQASAVAEELLDEASVAEIAPRDLAPVPAEEASDRPRLARVVLEICRPGSSSTEVLLDFAMHFAKRAMLFAATSKGLRLAGHRAKAPLTLDDAKVKGLLLPPDMDGAVGKVLHERVPTRGAFEATSDSDRVLLEAIQPVPEGGTILFPIALHDRAIGLLYGDGVPPGDPGLLEDLAAAVAATAVVMENKLFARTAAKK